MTWRSSPLSPFALIVLRLSGQERLLIPVVVMQTLAANLGSMLTPIGNPQNLYLYSRSGISFGGLCALMAPYVLLSGVCLAAVILVRRPAAVAVAGPGAAAPARPPRADRTPLYCTALFALCLLALFDVLPPLAVAAVALAFLLLCDRPLLRAVDYSLLGTFVAFFIFIGNLGRLEIFRGALSAFISGREELAAVLASQVISNVPAALLLAGFTQDWPTSSSAATSAGWGRSSPPWPASSPTARWPGPIPSSAGAISSASPPPTSPSWPSCSPSPPSSDRPAAGGQLPPPSCAWMQMRCAPR